MDILSVVRSYGIISVSYLSISTKSIIPDAWLAVPGSTLGFPQTLSWTHGKSIYQAAQ
jgi:hypothetical protein